MAYFVLGLLANLAWMALEGHRGFGAWMLFNGWGRAGAPGAAVEPELGRSVWTRRALDQGPAAGAEGILAP